MSEVYLGTKRLCEKIDCAPQTLYNWVCQKKLICGLHYVKPTKGKLLFKWSAIQAWLEKSCNDGSCDSGQIVEASTENVERKPNTPKPSPQPMCKINI